MKHCGNPKCCTSTNIAEQTSHGSGLLDDNGFWQMPCAICSRHYEDRYNDDWPPADKVMPEMPIVLMECPICHEIRDELPTFYRLNSDDVEICMRCEDEV